MPKVEWLTMELYSRRLLDADFAGRQLRGLALFGDGVFRPERCDVYEPLREKFDLDDLSKPIRWLVQPGGEFKFKRNRPLRIQGYISNKLFPQMRGRAHRAAEWEDFKPSVPEPLFCTQWAVWIDSAAAQEKGAEFLRCFLTEMFRTSEADYGFLTTESDHKAKNFLVQRDSEGTVEKFVGDDPEKGLPGLYWLNVFGRVYVDWFGRERIKQVPATLIQENPEGSVLLQFGDMPADSETPEVRRRQQAAIGILGEEAFFDITQPDRTLAIPPWARVA